MKFTKRELELQAQQSLEDFKNKVIQEARKRLLEMKIQSLNTTHLREIKSQSDFDFHVRSIVSDTVDNHLF